MENEEEEEEDRGVHAWGVCLCMKEETEDSCTQAALNAHTRPLCVVC